MLITISRRGPRRRRPDVAATAALAAAGCAVGAGPPLLSGRGDARAATVQPAALDPLCEADYAQGPFTPAPALRFGIDPELAGSTGTTQTPAKPINQGKAIAALRALRSATPIPAATRQMLGVVRRCFMPLGGLGKSVPIWITESGYDTTPGVHTGAQQRAALVQVVETIRRAGGTFGVTDFRWFNLRDNVSTATTSFQTDGLLTDDYRRKPSFAAYRDLIARFGAAPPGWQARQAKRIGDEMRVAAGVGRSEPAAWSAGPPTKGPDR